MAINFEEWLYCKYWCVLTYKFNFGGGGGEFTSNVLLFSISAISSVLLPLKIASMIFLFQHGKTNRLAKFHFLLHLILILSALLPNPTYNKSSRYCVRWNLQSIFLKGFIDKHDRRSAGPRVPVCTS